MAAPPARIVRECVEGYLYCPDPLRVLLFRRPPERGRIWVPISGKVDPGDASLEAAMRRELAEETGLREPRRIDPLEWHVPFDGPSGELWRLHAYAVEVPEGWSPTLSAEHEAFEWTTAAEARRRLHYPDNRAAVGRLVRWLGGPSPGAPSRSPPRRPFRRR
ncbi:lipoyltransferase [mine drainage metagenome]|uniref:Lipoyltransferase n=1 Tax=mine drainage metagenome TaxID=410659 RepID=T0YDE9_9ZZZZ